MASFDDYLREVRLSVEQFDNMSLEMKEVERGRFIEWLKLKNPQSTAGKGRLYGSL